MLVNVLNSCLLHAASQLEAAQEGAAARVALLAVTILTALNVHTQADKDPKIKPLLSAAWRVSHQTQLNRRQQHWAASGYI